MALFSLHPGQLRYPEQYVYVSTVNSLLFFNIFYFYAEDEMSAASRNMLHVMVGKFQGGDFTQFIARTVKP